MPFCIGWVENFDEITLSGTVKKIEANSCFFIFGKNLKIQNGRHFCMVKEIEANLCFAIFDKNLKIQNGRHFRGREIFF